MDRTGLLFGIPGGALGPALGGMLEDATGVGAPILAVSDRQPAARRFCLR